MLLHPFWSLKTLVCAQCNCMENKRSNAYKGRRNMSLDFKLPGTESRALLCVGWTSSVVVRVSFHLPLPAGWGRGHWDGVSTGSVSGGRQGSRLSCRKLQSHPGGGGRGDGDASAGAGRASWCNALSRPGAFTRGLSLAGLDRRDPGAEQVSAGGALGRSLGEGLGESLQLRGRAWFAQGGGLR